MYIVGHGFDLPDGNVKIPSIRQLVAYTVDEARSLRKMGDDLVFVAESGEILQDDAWLFDWEKEDPLSYARQKLRSSSKMIYV